MEKNLSMSGHRDRFSLKAMQIQQRYSCAIDFYLKAGVDRELRSDDLLHRRDGQQVLRDPRGNT